MCIHTLPAVQVSLSILALCIQFVHREDCPLQNPENEDKLPFAFAKIVVYPRLPTLVLYFVF